MCKLKKYHGTSNTRIDKCMRGRVKNIEVALKDNIRIIACCCGHKKYPETIVIEATWKNLGEGWCNYLELYTGIDIPRSRNFYKKDKQGYYYIPEVK